MRRVISLISVFLSISIQAKVLNFAPQKEAISSKNEAIESYQDSQLEVKFNLIQAVLSDRAESVSSKSFHQVKLSGFNLNSENGVPELPFYSKIVVGHPATIKTSVKKGNPFIVEGVQVRPALESPCRCKDKKFVRRFDKRVYFEKKSGVQLTYLGDFRGVPLTKISIQLAEQGPDKLVFYPQLQVSFDGVNQLHPLARRSPSAKKYFVLGPKKLVNELKPLISLRESQGYQFDINYLEDRVTIDPDSLKSFIQKSYRENNFQYALMVGDEKTLGTFDRPTTFDQHTPTDLPYFTMGGDDDRIPDVYYGRIVASSPEDVRGQVAKIVAYEGRTKFAGTQIGIASNEGFGPSDEEYVTSMSAPFESTFSFKLEKYFQSREDGTADEIVLALNRGVGWLNYIGHGVGDSWPSVFGRAFDTSDVKRMVSQTAHPVIIDVACQNGRFSLDNRLGERFMNERKEGKAIGAVAYYGGSVDISWDPPALMAIAISEKLAKEKYTELGETLMAGQLELIETYEDTEKALENLVWYHLLGDPALHIQL